MSGASAPSLVDGKNNSRDTESVEYTQSELEDHLDLSEDSDDRYDCREVYRNMEFEGPDGATTGFRCNSWSCYCCGHRMRMNLIEDLERLVEERPEMRRLLTLTLDPETAPESQEEQHEYLTDRYNALRTELKDRFPDLSYIWIREEGESGNPHLHVLVDRYIDQGLLSRLSARVGLGEIVDIRRVNARNAAKYLTKYLGKGAFHALPEGARRYGSSSDVNLSVRSSNDSEDSDWRLMMDDYEIQPEYGEGPLRREVEKTDLYRQKKRGSPVGLPPPENHEANE